MNWLRKLLRYPAPTPVFDPGCCIDCGKHRHRNDSYEIVAWKHKRCDDPKGIGQGALPHALDGFMQQEGE